MPVRIIADSACDMASADHPQLTVLPLTVAFGTAVYQDGVDLSHERFYELLIESDELPSTGQVNPYAYTQAYEEAVAAGEDIVVIALSSKLSGTHQSAVTAAAQIDAPVRIVDTQSVTVGEHILVKYALQLVDRGLGVQQIADASRPRAIAWLSSACSIPLSTCVAAAESPARWARWARCFPSSPWSPLRTARSI